MYLIFDTETTGLPKRWDAPISDSENWPRAIQIAWQLHDEMGELVEHDDFLIQPDGFNIPYDAEKIHGISTELAAEDGITLQEGLARFQQALGKTKFIVGQNVGFDVNIMGAEFYREGIETKLTELPVLDTCTETTAQLCQIPGGRGGKFKLPTLTELHEHLFGEPFAEAHNATADVEATTRCFLELVRQRIYTVEQLDVAPDYFENYSEANPQPIQLIGLKHINLKKASEAIRKKMAKQEPQNELSEEELQENIEVLQDEDFVHLHNHSQYSILQSTISVQDLVKAAADKRMPAVALTDHANMMGAFHFVSAIAKHNDEVKKKREEAEANGETYDGKEITGIVGCEFFVCENHTDKSRKDNGYQVVLLAKNKKGYHNLAKMSSLAYTDGFYYVPRIDKEVIKRYKEDVMVLTGNLYGEVPSKVLNVGENQAEEALLWWKEEFGEDRMRFSQEMMALYKREQVNPLSGCLPLLLQMPIFLALYWVLMESVELRHAPWLGWIQDLSAMDPWFILPLIMGVTMFVQQMLNPQPTDPMQAKVFRIMPIMFTVFMLFFPAGLVLYWIVNNSITILQQWFINKGVEKDRLNKVEPSA